MGRSRRSVPGYNFMSSLSDNLEGALEENKQVTPFLAKTYDLVNDPSTDEIVAWCSDGRSFVVKQNELFSLHLLPKQFKHGNFSSFVRQLNTYGFKKIDSDTWRFSHKNFVKDRPELLARIERKKKEHEGGSKPLQPSASPAIEVGAYGDPGELVALKRDKDFLAHECIRLRKHQANLEHKMLALQNEMLQQRKMSAQMYSLMVKAFKEPHFLQQFLQGHTNRSGQARYSSDHLINGRKKRRASSFEAASPDIGSPHGEVEEEEAVDDTGALVQYQPYSNTDIDRALSAFMSSAPPASGPQPGLSEVNQAFGDMALQNTNGFAGYEQQPMQMPQTSGTPMLEPVRTQRRGGLDQQQMEPETDSIGHMFQEISPSFNGSDAFRHREGDWRDVADDPLASLMQDGQPSAVLSQPDLDNVMTGEWLEYINSEPNDGDLPFWPDKQTGPAVKLEDNSMAQ